MALSRTARTWTRLKAPRTWAPPLGLVAVIALWEAVVRGFAIPDIIIPAPSAIARSFWFGFSSGVYLHHAMLTAFQAVLGFIVALVVGITAGTLVASVKLIEKAFYPLIVAFQAMPKVALAPLAIVWFGYGPTSKIVIAAVIAFFPILVNTVAGLKSCDSGKIDIMQSLGANGWQIFRMVRLPNALPYVFAGAHVASAFVVLGAVVGEFLGSKEGLGTLILIANGNLDVAQVFAILVMLGALGFGFYMVIRVAQRRLLRWAPMEMLAQG